MLFRNKLAVVGTYGTVWIINATPYAPPLATHQPLGLRLGQRLPGTLVCRRSPYLRPFGGDVHGGEKVGHEAAASVSAAPE